jgi:hybrid cluster-associated redox disulfide protein
LSIRNDLLPASVKMQMFPTRMAKMQSLLHRDMTMDEIMRRWPGTIRVAIRNGMLCVGCPIAPFHTVDDAAREHVLDEAALRQTLEAAITPKAEARVAIPSRSGLRRA